MAFSVLKCYEYSMRCDECGDEEVLYTGDYILELGITVHDKRTAIKAAEYHESEGRLLCDKCFSRRMR